ncbi:MAG: PilZ domain-containing protein [Pseudomonadota bacterium]
MVKPNTPSRLQSETSAHPESADDKDRRRHHRVDAPLKARFMDETGVEHPCIAVNISAAGALFRAKQPPRAGSSVVLYVDDVGRFDAKVIRSGEKSFAVHYEKRRKKTAKTADDLTRVLNQGRRSSDRRQSPRVMHDAPAHIMFEDGRVQECAILDISLTGASLEIAPRPPLGTHLILGRMTAKVVRRHDKGVGVVFTGAASRLSDVIAGAAEPVPERPGIEVGPGARLATPFGKKPSNG